MSDVLLADVCVLACAEAFRPDADRVVSPMGTVPRLGALLAMATFQPDLMLSDGEAQVLVGPVPLGAEAEAPKSAWIPFREVFQVVNQGRRHVMMGATQIDGHGNQNISTLGDWARPAVQLIGARGAPGNTVNHTTSYWVSDHSPRVFVESVDFVSGVGTDRPGRGPFHDLRTVVTNLAVLDLGGPDGSLRLVSTHPGVTVDDVTTATACALHVEGDIPTTPVPDADQLALIDHFDPRGVRFHEVPRSEVG